MTLDEATMRAALEQMVREKDEEIERLKGDLTALADRLQYRGNSISWIHSKADKYRLALDDAWTALKAAGIFPDGQADVAEGVRLLAARIMRT